MGLIPFDPEAPAYLFVPERFEEEEVPVPERTAKLAEPVSVTGRQNDRFRAAVATAVDRMKAGELSKIVLSRVLTARYAPGALNLDALYNNLRAQQRTAFNFAVRLPEGERGMSGSYLMGASPSWCSAPRAAPSRPTRWPVVPRASAEPGSAEDEAIRDRLFTSPRTVTSTPTSSTTLPSAWRPSPRNYTYLRNPRCSRPRSSGTWRPPSTAC